MATRLKRSDMSWVTYKSPLWKKDKVPDKVKPLPSPREMGEMENNFVNDAVEVYMRSQYRKFPIIPPYNAVKDKYAQAYFQSSLVKGILTRNELLRKNAEEIQDENRLRGLNKMSIRRICKGTPTKEELKQREKGFVNDAIVTEKRRTKYKDTLIPVYNAVDDKYCNTYFSRPDVQRLLKKTSPTSSVASSPQTSPRMPVSHRR